jgi:hypothetical protein
MNVAKPRKRLGDCDYDIDCEEALAPAFNDLADMAESNGWNGDVVAAALLSLADANIKGRSENRKTDNAILKAKRIN